MSSPQLKLLEAAWCHYRAKLLEAEANLEKYLSETVAIPDHSSVLNEIISWTNKVGHAKMALNVLKTKMPAAKLRAEPPWRDSVDIVTP
tara:strand:+ start:2113 stop:2379 length:267 start_codon:yes stop_codon:yes gene_type:complete